MKLSNILFESEGTDLIHITGYHRSDNPDFKISDITMNPRITRQSKRSQEDKIGFYITMPKIKISSAEDIPTKLIAAPDTGQHYGEFLYKIKIAVPREQIFLNTYILGSTRISPKALAALKYSMCPECRGSKPPVTRITFSFFERRVLSIGFCPKSLT
jgi:hypothetical protein